MTSDENRFDPLDRFFRKKSEEYDDIAFREQDWLKLKNRLDVQDARLTYRRRVRWLVAASILLVSLMGYFTYENYLRINEITRQLQDETPTAEHLLPDDPVIMEETPDAPEESSAARREDGSLPGQPDDDHEPVPLDDDSDPEPFDDGHDPAPLDDDTDPVPREESSRLADRELFRSERTDEMDPRLATREVLPRQLHSDMIRSEDIRENGLLSHVRPAISDSGTHIPSETEEAELIAGLFDRTQSGRFSLGFVTAPDLSTVGGVSNFDTPGYKFGLTISYNITPDLAISTGAVHSVVRYSARSREYGSLFFYDDSGTTGDIAAECRLVDIPVTMTYHFLNLDQSGFFATAGLSSYIMLNEAYQFTPGGYSPGDMERWEKRTGTAHWLSNAGFSIGYERNVHQNWNLRIEPFIKVPVRTVGRADVELYSLGSFVSIHYRL